MRALAASLVVLAGCAEISGLGSLDVCDGACVDATADVTQESAPDASIDVKSDAPFDVLADVPIIADGSIDAPPTLGCAKQSDCSQNDFCCGTVSTQGNYPQCQISTVSSKCATTCTTLFQFNKCGSDTVRLCATSQECTEQFYNRCCKYPYNDASISICTNIALADASGGTCP